MLSITSVPPSQLMGVTPRRALSWVFYFVAGAGVVGLSFWTTLTVLDYWDATTSKQTFDSASAYLSGVRALDRRNAISSDLVVTWDAGQAPGGRQSAILLEDRSPKMGWIVQDRPIKNDNSMHTVAIDIKAGTSPLSQILLAYFGGKNKVYHALVDLTTMAIRGERGIKLMDLGNGWYRVTLKGANNHSGNDKLRIQIFPRFGQPDDVGSLYIANVRLDPQE